MTKLARCSTVALAVSLGWAMPAQAQSGDQSAVQQEIAAMRAQMAAMAQRIDTLETELDAAQAKVDVAQQTATSAAQSASTAAAEKSPVDVEWKGAPKFSSDGGWSFKPRGRLQFDAGATNAPEPTTASQGFGSEIRRARLGVEGDIPGGFGYKFEVDFAGGDAEITDALVTYKDGGTKVSIGQQNNFQSLEELTSSRFNTMMERAAFTDAFGFERRVGVSIEQKAGDAILQAGIFSDNFNDLSNKSWSVDGRAVYAPKMGNTQLHLGGSAHYSELNNAATSVRYRQRPFVHFTSQRYIDTGAINATSETGFGLEAAAISGPFHAAAEGYWQHVGGTTLAQDPTFFGGYAEVGYFLTGGDKRGYKDGIFDRVKPANPVGQGGMGAVQLNLRYDLLDLNDTGITGGKQNGFGVSLIWTPTDYTRFMMNYGKMSYDDASITAAGGETSYNVDAFGMRAQVDF